MTLADVPSLVVCFPPGDAVEHRILGIPENRGQEAARFLGTLRDEFSFGPDGGSADAWMSIGFTFAGLEAVNMPESYLRVFRRLAPAFTQGAVRRSVNVSDSGESAPLHWDPGFAHAHAHVLVSWHGPRREVANRSSELAERWNERFAPDGPTLSWALAGQRLGAPPGEKGQWVHFGFRDGLSEVSIDEALPAAADRRKHLPGSLLLGHVNDAGFNEFALTRAPEKVRRFFRDSSFGVFRKIQQEVKAFEAQVDRWAVQMAQAIPGLQQPRDFVKAKLCGRWPDGRQLLRGELVPNPHGSLALKLDDDKAGEGCPFGSHVRRMRAAPDSDGNLFDRPLQRRGVPFGPAAWSQPPDDAAERGLLGQFFCASLEDQFEHLLSQWAARPPLGLAAMDRALDPFGGSRQDADAALAVPLKDRPTQLLRGFSAWTTAKGTMYAWHPGRLGLFALLDNDFVPEKDERPWL